MSPIRVAGLALAAVLLGAGCCTDPRSPASAAPVDRDHPEASAAVPAPPRFGRKPAFELTPSPEGSAGAEPKEWGQPLAPDRAFAQRLAARFDDLFNAMVDHLARTRALDQRFAAYLDAIYVPGTFRTLEAGLWDSDRFELGDRPGRASTTVQRVTAWSPGCIVVAVRLDRTPWYRPPFDEGDEQIHLAFVADADHADDRALNPTGWRLSYRGFSPSGEPPERPCTR